jgi:cytochrome c biogenesis protein CcdA/thiol-disulfide isomerase/thioredoxin
VDPVLALLASGRFESGWTDVNNLMRQTTLLLTLLLICLGSLLPVAQADQPVVRLLFFYSQDCPHCQAVIDEVLSPLQQKYGAQLEVQSIEISDPDNYQWLLDMEAAYQIPPDKVDIPEVFVGDTALIGEAEIRARLDETIASYLAAGGVDYPAIPGLLLEEMVVPADTPTPTPMSHIPTPTPGPVVRFWLFWDSHCGPCLTLMEDILPPILAKYEDGQVVVHARDLEKGDYELMRALEKQHGLEYGAMPEIFIGDQVLLGNEEIQAKLGQLIDEYLVQGGVALPEVTLAPTPTPASPAAEDRPSIHLAYFYQPGCRECDRAELDLRYLQQRYSLAVAEFDVREQSALCELLGERAGVPEEKRLTAPAVFVGDDALIGPEINAHSLEALVEKYVASGAPPIWNEFDPTAAKQSIVERFKSLGVFTVAFAGLIDGLNPCAFATLIFFVSYLTLSGRKGREVLAVGAAFTAGVFLAYLVVGLGFHRVLGALGNLLTTLGRWVYGLTAALCAVLAVLSFLDFRKARRGEIGDMALNLPHGLRMRINALIRRGRHSRTFVAGSFLTGILVSFLELACTGQVYLPTIIFVMSVPAMRPRAVLFLVFYNLLFIAPLVVVFILVWYGTTGAKQLTGFLQRRAATIKLGMALLFAGLAAWLVVALP